jgi:hypothetical protein
MGSTGVERMITDFPDSFCPVTTHLMSMQAPLTADF